MPGIRSRMVEAYKNHIMKKPGLKSTVRLIKCAVRN